MKKRWILLAPLFFLAFMLVGGEIVMHLWNWLLPPLFGWRLITFWQALGLLALCRILFGGWGGHGSGRSGRPNFRSRMKERMNERWERMTPAEREKFRQRFPGRCSPFEPPNAKPTA